MAALLETIPSPPQILVWPHSAYMSLGQQGASPGPWPDGRIPWAPQASLLLPTDEGLEPRVTVCYNGHAWDPEDGFLLRLCHHLPLLLPFAL